jgi:hypothetical protein
MPPKYETKAKERIRKGLQKYTAVLEAAAQRGINEEDTSVIVHEMLVDLLGYERFREVTGQYKVKGHFADWAVQIEDKIKFFVEVKALGTKLREKDLFQVTAYSRQGRSLDWAVITSGDVWQCFRVASGSEPEQFFEVRLMDPSQPLDKTLDDLYLLSREAASRDGLQVKWEQAECYRPEGLARALLGEEVLTVLKRVVKRENPGRRVDIDDLKEALARSVIRGDVYAAPAQTDTAGTARRKKHLPSAPAGDPVTPQA